MKRKIANKAFLFILGLIFSSLFFLSCKESTLDGMIVATQVPKDLQVVNYINGNNWRYFTNSQIVLIKPNRNNEPLKILTNNFYSACSPQISFDGKSMIFSAQKSKNDRWQIWEMNLENLKSHQITTSSNNCIDPAYLPGNSFVYSEFNSNSISKRGISLFTGNLDGTNIGQITYNPTTNFASTVLKDGRILTISREIYPNQKDGRFMVLRPDGTKELLFYKSTKNSTIISRGFETSNRKIVFIESESNQKVSDIMSISYNSPFHSKVNLTQKIKGDFYAVSQLKGDTLLTSYRDSKSRTYALYEFNSKNKTLGRLIYKNDNFNLLDPTVIKKHKRPRNLPSEVNLKSKTGLIICQNINFLDSPEAISKAVKIEVLGIDVSLGKVAVKKDGSFYLKVLADTPFRIQTIDDKGQIVNGPSSWMYLRPNERRGCIGCHENREQVPENRQPISVREAPVVLPKQIKEINKIY
jgi:Hydrazine synthase alpha subunit middle domain